MSIYGLSRFNAEEYIGVSEELYLSVIPDNLFFGVIHLWEYSDPQQVTITATSGESEIDRLYSTEGMVWKFTSEPDTMYRDDELMSYYINEGEELVLDVVVRPFEMGIKSPALFIFFTHQPGGTEEDNYMDTITAGYGAFSSFSEGLSGGNRYMEIPYMSSVYRGGFNAVDYGGRIEARTIRYPLPYSARKNPYRSGYLSIGWIDKKGAIEIRQSPTSGSAIYEITTYNQDGTENTYSFEATAADTPSYIASSLSISINANIDELVITKVVGNILFFSSKIAEVIFRDPNTTVIGGLSAWISNFSNTGSGAGRKNIAEDMLLVITPGYEGPALIRETIFVLDEYQTPRGSFQFPAHPTATTMNMIGVKADGSYGLSYSIKLTNEPDQTGLDTSAPTYHTYFTEGDYALITTLSEKIPSRLYRTLAGFVYDDIRFSNTGSIMEYCVATLIFHMLGREKSVISIAQEYGVSISLYRDLVAHITKYSVCPWRHRRLSDIVESMTQSIRSDFSSVFPVDNIDKSATIETMYLVYVYQKISEVV